LIIGGGRAIHFFKGLNTFSCNYYKEFILLIDIFVLGGRGGGVGTKLLDISIISGLL